MPGAPPSLLEREEISVALITDPKVAWAVIARCVGRHATTIAREATVNGGRRRYRPAVAEKPRNGACSDPGARSSRSPGPIRDRVMAELTAGRSPEAIWADLNVDEITGRVCVEMTELANIAPAHAAE